MRMRKNNNGKYLIGNAYSMSPTDFYKNKPHKYIKETNKNVALLKERIKICELKKGEFLIQFNHVSITYLDYQF